MLSLLTLPVLTLMLSLPAQQAAAQAPNAAYERARYYRGMTGEKIDLDQALQYTRQAAEQGHGPAQLDLAFSYYNGTDKLPKDPAQAFHWFSKASDQGVVAARCMLGDFYQGGLGGVKQNDRKAVALYRSAATTSDRCAPKAQYALYTSYASGQGVGRDLKAAMGWLHRAAEGGNPQAQRSLGQRYDHGDGIKKDPDLARHWSKKSREGVSWHEDHDSNHAAGKRKDSDHDHTQDGHAPAAPKSGR